MKNIVILILFAFSTLNAQFSVKISGPKEFQVKDAYLYILNGSKDILINKAAKQGDGWFFSVKNTYSGLLKVYFPEANVSANFISDNSNVDFSFSLKNNKIYNVDYKDETNKLFYELQDLQKKKEQILPALYQIQSYYKDNSDFGIALKNEVEYLNSSIIYDPSKYPFINYYNQNYQKYLLESAGKATPNNDEIINFLNTTNNFLETSSLLKPILMAFLSNTSKANISEDVDKLLKTVNVETPRGQTILSELIEIFNVYNIKDLKEKYLNEAKSLKCTINDRLTSTLKSNLNTAVGNIIPNNKFISATNTKVKSLHDVKADKKIVILWSSTCPHCEKEITEMLTKYNDLKAKNIEIVGLSLDTDSKSYADKAKILPWINDTELKGWYSSYVDIYNVHATPTFYIVDANNKIIANPDNFSEILEFLGIK